MTDTIMPAFIKFRQEAAIIGRILAGYAELELELCFCIAVAKDDFDLAFKIMFRPRGESQRVQIADAVGRPCYNKLQLGRHFEDAISAVKFCLKLRNQYAHCQWHSDYGRQLGFIELEGLAQKNQHVPDLSDVRIKQLDLTLLQHQEAYFIYTRDLLHYLNFEGRKREGKLTNHNFSIPKRAERPIPYNP